MCPTKAICRRSRPTTRLRPTSSRLKNCASAWKWPCARNSTSPAAARTRLKKELEEAKDAREKKRHGELLKQVMSTVSAGDTHVVARDYETGEEVKIALDPQLTPAENLERYFKKYHKGLVGTNMLGQQLEITKSHLSDITALQAELAAITDMAALQAFAERPLIKELCDKHCPKAEKNARRKRSPKKGSPRPHAAAPLPHQRRAGSLGGQE
ncbi:MAG: NFACT family protein [Planctomycetota bacterium]|nr:NFACT family protein [Planctomycetota bacterium]